MYLQKGEVLGTYVDTYVRMYIDGSCSVGWLCCSAWMHVELSRTSVCCLGTYLCIHRDHLTGLLGIIHTYST